MNKLTLYFISTVMYFVIFFCFYRRSEEKRITQTGKRKTKGGNPTNFSAKKPKAGKGQRNPGKKAGGRKRR